MTAKSILAELEPLGKPGYKSVLLNHGAAEPCFGVPIAELKKIQKRVKKDYRLALELYDTGNYDAMYLAGLIADDALMTRQDLQGWAARASRPLAGTTVASVAAESRYGWELALDWIASDQDRLAAAGWATLSNLVSIKDDASLDLEALERLLGLVQRSIFEAPNEARYQMNGFVIALGCYCAPLKDLAAQAAEQIGRVEVEMGNTACQVPFAPDYIRKVELRGAIGKKRKSARL